MASDRRSGHQAPRGGARGGPKSRGSRHKRTDLGRAEWSRNALDKRARHEENQQAVKRRRLDGEEPTLPIYATQFSQEEIANEPKKPKRKVAVMMGYSGSGYKGMQLNHNERTIEGDLFKAFVSAGAISKANADDPKKSALIRCARTDKGVHAAGNLVSLKMIVEDPDIVSKINEKLSPQIRVFGIERTNGSFSAYQFCDSRIYEYLIPTHCFLPPHPSSFLAKRLLRTADETSDLKGYEERQEEVFSYWAEIEAKCIRPVLESIDSSIRPLAQKALYAEHTEEDQRAGEEVPLGKFGHCKEGKQGPEACFEGNAAKQYPESLAEYTSDPEVQVEACSSPRDPIQPNLNPTITPANVISRDEKGVEAETLSDPNSGSDAPKATESTPTASQVINPGDEQNMNGPNSSESANPRDRHIVAEARSTDETVRSAPKELSPLDIAIRRLRLAYINAKKAYRIHPRRLERVRSTLSRFLGTQNFHNYTVEKNFRDASAKRVIKSFVVASDPIIIDGTEWLSLKVHGQSFMMHQIRKMVSMAALVVRCGCHEGRIQDSYLADKLSIPKAPGLGLLLERPVFDTYNERLVGQYERAPIDFKKYEKEMDEFKQREIYQRIFEREETDNTFHSFFTAIDNLKAPRLLYLSSAGVAATKDGSDPTTAHAEQKKTPRRNKQAAIDEVTLVGIESDSDATLHDDDGGDEKT